MRRERDVPNRTGGWRRGLMAIVIAFIVMGAGKANALSLSLWEKVEFEGTREIGYWGGVSHGQYEGMPLFNVIGKWSTLQQNPYGIGVLVMIGNSINPMVMEVDEMAPAVEYFSMAYLSMNTPIGLWSFGKGQSFGSSNAWGYGGNGQPIGIGGLATTKTELGPTNDDKQYITLSSTTDVIYNLMGGYTTPKALGLQLGVQVGASKHNIVADSMVGEVGVNYDEEIKALGIGGTVVYRSFHSLDGRDHGAGYDVQASAQLQFLGFTAMSGILYGRITNNDINQYSNVNWGLYYSIWKTTIGVYNSFSNVNHTDGQVDNSALVQLAIGYNVRKWLSLQSAVYWDSMYTEGISKRTGAGILFGVIILPTFKGTLMPRDD